MAEKRPELQAGIAFILSVIIVIVGILWFKNFKIGAKKVKIQVEFPTTSGLLKGDPVEVRGVSSGEVDAIKYSERGAVVTMQISRKIPLHQDAQITIKDVGIMGQKMISVEPGTTRFPVVPDTALFHGTYEPGIPEFITNMGQTVETFNRLGQRLDQLVAGVEANRKGNVGETLENIRVVTAELRSFLEETRGELAASVRNFNSASAGLNDALGSRSQEIGRIIDNAARASVRFDSTLAHLDRTAAGADSILSAVNSGKGSMGKIVNDEALYRELLDTVRETRALVTDMKEHPHRYLRVSVF